MAVETAYVDAYITGILSADSALAATGITGIFGHFVPGQQATPYVLFTQSGAGDDAGVGAVRYAVEFDYIVRVVDKNWTFTTEMQTAANRIDALLQKSTGVALGHAIEGCIRMAPYIMVQETQDLPWRHLGGRYHFWVAV